jgi:hypothetical protein
MALTSVLEGENHGLIIPYGMAIFQMPGYRIATPSMGEFFAIKTFSGAKAGVGR